MTCALRNLGIGALSLLLVACHGKGPAAVDSARLVAADHEPGAWMSYGRTYSEQRFSPLTGVDTRDVGKLGLAWRYTLATNRGVEATPIVVDGVMYVTSSWSLVYALDARTGRLLWKYDPQVPREVGFHACCDVVNRGVAVWKGRVYVATLDGRLVALDARTGAPIWSAVTVDQSKPYTITMAPRIIKGKVMIGNSGSEYGVRGYMSAYDADSGKLIWRFYTVPGDPAKGFETKAMAMAAKTWTGTWWTFGGGATPWDSMSYDAESNLLYFGTGNGLPWDRAARSPAGGDNLFVASIIAVDADTGAYRWHYQTTPGESWDFDATQTLVLADLIIDGRPRKVILQANKNGFFYVLDRLTGKLVSANNFVPVNWATGVDRASGRPQEVAAARYTAGPALVFPSSAGAHNWQPMAFSPRTGLVYIPGQEVSSAYAADKTFKFQPGQLNLSMDMRLADLPDDPRTRNAIKNGMRGELIAWDPVEQAEVWRVDHNGPWNGGVLATAGGLVFQGTGDGHFNAYDAANGHLLWSADTYASALAGPMTYAVDGKQYVAVAAGFGTEFYLDNGFAVPKLGDSENGQILVYAIGGSAHLPKPITRSMAMPRPPASTATPARLASGLAAFNRYCAACHGGSAISGGVIPDLRYSPLIGSEDAFELVVLGGVKTGQGMVSFAKVLTPNAVEAIRHYVIAKAKAGYAAADPGRARQTPPAMAPGAP